MKQPQVQYPITEYSLATVRTMQVLEALAFEPMTAPRLAEGLGMHPRTVRRMMTGLRAVRYVEQRPAAAGPARHTYLPTLRLLSLAVQLTRHHPAVVHAREVVRQLREATDLAAYAAMPTHDQVVVIARSGRDAPAAWAVLDAGGSAVGQVLLAHRQHWRDQLGASQPGERAAAADRERGYVVAEEPGGLASLGAVIPAPVEPELAVAVTGRAALVHAEERALAATVARVAVASPA